MKNRHKLTTALILFFGVFTTNAQSIAFKKGTLEDAIAEAKAKNKLVFVDVYTTWCGPCKFMDQTVFILDDDVSTFYNENFINYKLDAEDPKINGPELVGKYGAAGYPTYWFIDGDGKLVSSEAGAMPKESFINIGRSALGLDVLSEYYALEGKFENGDHSVKTLRAFISMAFKTRAVIADKTAQDKANKLLSEALAIYTKRDPKEFVNAEDFYLLSNQEVYWALNLSRGFPAIEYMIDHYDDYKKVVANEEDLGTFLMYMNHNGIKNEATTGNKEKYKEYLKDITGKLAKAYAFNDEEKMPAVAVLTAIGDSEYAASQKDYDTYLIEYDKYLKLNPDLSAIDYLMPARRILFTEKEAASKAILKKCIPFNEIAYNQYKNAYVCTDFGKLWAKLGDNDKARDYYAEAMKMFEEMGGERGEMMTNRFKKEMEELGL